MLLCWEKKYPKEIFIKACIKKNINKILSKYDMCQFLTPIMKLVDRNT